MGTKLVNYLIVVVAFGLLFFGSYLYGYSQAEKDAKVTELQELKEANERNTELQQKYSAISLALEEEKKKIKVKTEVVTKEVIKYVQNPNRTICKFDDDWLQIRQSILENADTRNESATRTLPTEHGANPQ